jgi:hypothetical protein
LSSKLKLWMLAPKIPDAANALESTLNAANTHAHVPSSKRRSWRAATRAPLRLDHASYKLRRGVGEANAGEARSSDQRQWRGPRRRLQHRACSPAPSSMSDPDSGGQTNMRSRANKHALEKYTYGKSGISVGGPLASGLRLLSLATGFDGIDNLLVYNLRYKICWRLFCDQKV